MKYFALLFWLAAPFWETSVPADWSDAQLKRLLTDSPWAQLVGAMGSSSARPIQVLVATAGPIEQGEAEWDRRFRKKKAGPDLMKEEYRVWFQENHASQIVLAISAGKSSDLADESEIRRMKEQSVMIVGRKKYKMTGYFPPSDGDPYLRIAFPREVTASDKMVNFELYVPGVGIPFRAVEFKVKEMMVKGKLEI
jgi:hypothetical protein